MVELQSIWGWQPALYLFLGGLGAGAFVTAAVMAFKNFELHKKTIGITALLSFCSLAVGLLLLLTELTNPLRGLLMWQSFSNPSSWMMIGAWLLFVAIIVMLFVTFLTFEPFFKLLSRIEVIKRHQIAWVKVLAGIGALLGLGVAVYTGVLLMSAPGVPLWNTALLPCIFTVSALDTGVALVELVDAFAQKDRHVAHRSRRKFEGAVIALVIIEAIAIIAFCQVMLGGNPVAAVANESSIVAAQNSIQVLLSGKLSMIFWGWFVFVGLVVPLLSALIGLVTSDGLGKIVGIVGAVCALVGGCVLRFIILAAGLHANVLVDAVSNIIFY